MLGDDTPEAILMKFGTPIDIHNFITPANFGAMGTEVGLGAPA